MVHTNNVKFIQKDPQDNTSTWTSLLFMTLRQHRRLGLLLNTLLGARGDGGLQGRNARGRLYQPRNDR